MSLIRVLVWSRCGLGIVAFLGNPLARGFVVLVDDGIANHRRKRGTGQSLGAVHEASTLNMVGPRPQEIVAAGYDAVADRYSDWQSQIIDDPREPYVRKLLSIVPERPDILEIGCGGAIEPTPTFARRGHLVGIDISQVQIERAWAALPDAELIHGDVTTTEFDPDSFDAVVALFVLTHIPTSDLPELLGAIFGWLRDGGLFLGTFGSGRAHEGVVDDWLGAPMFFSNLDERANDALLRDAGFTAIASRIEPMHEPPSEPGRGAETISFHWVLAQKRSPSASSSPP